MDAHSTTTDLDKPIHSKDEDKLGRTRFVEQLSTTLIDWDQNTATGAVIGLCGEWGSGKSSILNLLEQHIKSGKQDAIVVRFDPWLISTREALIKNFMTDLSLAIQQSGQVKPSLKDKVADLISDYDGLINVGIDALALLGQAAVLGGAIKAGKDKLKAKQKTLHQTKSDLAEALQNIAIPIVVLIDEVDRLEDREILEIMRLVKAVVDFPNISYLVAYDVNRVIQALGSGANDKEVEERGRSYLEKIIQYQVQIPALFEDELIDMLRREIDQIVPNFKVPDHRLESSRYAKLENSVFPQLLHTPRDLKRVLGTFRSLFRMMSKEVNWIDLLGYSVLLTKAPGVAEAIKNDPIFFTGDFSRAGVSLGRFGSDAPTTEQQLTEKLAVEWEKLPYSNLVRFLFPRFRNSNLTDQLYGESDHTELQYYRALCFLARQGTPPGVLPIASVKELFNLPDEEISLKLDRIVEEEKFGDLNYVLSYHYNEYEDCDHVRFWTSLAKWCRKPDTTIPTIHDPRVGYIESIESSFRDALSSHHLARVSMEIISRAVKIHANEFACDILINQIFAHGLFGKKNHHDFKAVGNKKGWEVLCKNAADDWKKQHLAGDWYFGSWKETPVWFLINVGVWDNACKKRLTKLTESPSAFDAFILMIFGRHYAVDRDGVSTLVEWSSFCKRLKQMQRRQKSLSGSSDIKEAFEKASSRLSLALQEE